MALARALVSGRPDGVAPVDADPQPRAVDLVDGQRRPLSRAMDIQIARSVDASEFEGVGAALVSIGGFERQGPPGERQLGEARLLRSAAVVDADHPPRSLELLPRPHRRLD